MSSLSIRVATIDDVSDIIKIRLRTLTNEEVSGFSAQEFANTSSTKKLRESWNQKNILKDDLEVFVVEKCGISIGYMMFKVEGDSGYIDDVVVAKEEQGKGVGKYLVTYAENVTKSRGCYLMKTDTTENVDGIPWKSYNFWLKMGYEDTGKRVPTNYDFNEIHFVKKLR